jgi:hypothetical protein
VTGSDTPLTPAEEEVRRLLAEARHTGPTPPDVVARLDRVLGDLSQEPVRTAPVVDLARRRRRVGSLLVAAAAVVAIGVGLGQVIALQSGSDSSQAGDAGTVADAERDGALPEAQSDGPGKPAGGDVTPLNDDRATLSSVRPDHFADDLTSARREVRGRGSFSYKADSANEAAGALCSADSWGRGRFVPVRYGKTPAVLVFRRPVRDTQVVDLFLCGSEEPERSVTLPAP